MLANGHPDAESYPVARVWDEATTVVERKNGEYVSLAIVIQQATLTTGMAAGPKANEGFKAFVKGLAGE